MRFGGSPAAERRATLLYGAGWAGVMMARSASRDGDSGIVTVGFLDDDPHLAGSRVAGLPVFGGPATLPDAVEATRATSLLITMPSAAGEANRPRDLCARVTERAGLEPTNMRSDDPAGSSAKPRRMPRICCYRSQRLLVSIMVSRC